MAMKEKIRTERRLPGTVSRNIRRICRLMPGAVCPLAACAAAALLMILMAPGAGLVSDAPAVEEAVSFVEEAASFGEEEAAFGEEAANFGEEAASFGEETADFGETEAGFGEEEAAFGEEAAPGATAVASRPVIQHVDRYLPPKFFPERKNRSFKSEGAFRIIPLTLILGMGLMMFAFGRSRTEKKPVRADKPISGRIISALFLIAGAAALTAPGVQALTYYSAKDAVTSSLGGGKIFQKKIAITPEISRALQADPGWTPEKTAYKAYYVKDADGKPAKYAFILSDRLEICGGLHKYCVAVSAAGVVEDVKILELTCDRSYCVNSKAYLAKYKGFDDTVTPEKAKKYNAVTGATLSTELTTKIVRRALALFHLVAGK